MPADRPRPTDLPDPAELAGRLIAGDRRALARAITLAESTLAGHRQAARAILAHAAHAVRTPGPTLRIGVTGAPGVGKSTFIEGFGLRLAAAGQRVAVLAVDPSSVRSGGSILGDKTRMERLARSPGAFIRPSPAGGMAGGVARRTREAILLCEAAGYAPVIVETVGVGQSETLVAAMTDLFILLIAPAGGDELQGVKRGIMEAADLVLVTKADRALADTARATCAEYRAALHLLRRRSTDPEGFPKAMTVSATTGAGLGEAMEAIARLAAWREARGLLALRRREQAMAAFEDEVRLGLAALIAADPAFAAGVETLRGRVARGDALPGDAADEALATAARRLGAAGDRCPGAPRLDGSGGSL